ncbi:MAG TPA: RodZ domain-containing protein [Streptosporangiaceae bacterium]|nr:RodZ domain-containing protein [Streptosporangiaceae bacterium]
MSIGDALADGRRQAGLTVTQVSQRTCIRETIIRGIERGDFSGCGGDFYARGHIRSIGGAVGVNPEPLIEEYDATMGAPQAISAADVFQPVTPVRLKERRRPNWTAAMALALVVIAGVFAYQHFASHSATAAKQDARVQNPSTASKPKITTSPAAVRRAPHRMRIKLTAVRDCWVQLTSTGGATLFSGMVYAGNSMNWTERHPVTMVLGNPSGVKVLVNGKNPVPPGSVRTVTLSLHAGLAH